jgi:hypothetical protein
MAANLRLEACGFDELIHRIGMQAVSLCNPLASAQDHLRQSSSEIFDVATVDIESKLKGILITVAPAFVT